jgi:peptidoglycan/xylan/chitin deacetylase (PgdA/CDA1 family)
MRIVSPILKHAVYPALHHSGWLARIKPSSGYAVVNYHGLIPSDHSEGDSFLDGNLVRPEVFRQQLQFLKSHYCLIHPEDFRAWVERSKPLPPRALLVTCDDGLLNTLTDMLPILQSEGVSCLFFVTGASCGDNPGLLWYEELYHLMHLTPLSELESQLPPEAGSESSSESFQTSWWSTVKRACRLNAKDRADWMALVRKHCGPTQRLHSERRWRLLTAAELKLLPKAGMTIGAHTLTHPILSLCSDEEARREIEECKSALEGTLGLPIWALAYPFGNPSTMGERELRLAQESGFSCAFLNVEHWGGAPSNQFAVPRTHITSQTTVAELAAHLSGLHNQLQRVVGG